MNQINWWSFTPTHQQSNYLYETSSTVSFETPLAIASEALQWRHNEYDGVLKRQSHECLLNLLFKAQIKESIKTPRH